MDCYADQFAMRLIPIAFGKFIGIALVDHRNLARAFFYLFRRRRAQAITVHRIFPALGCE